MIDSTYDVLDQMPISTLLRYRNHNLTRALDRLTIIVDSSNTPGDNWQDDEYEQNNYDMLVEYCTLSAMFSNAMGQVK